MPQKDGQSDFASKLMLREILDRVRATETKLDALIDFLNSQVVYQAESTDQPVEGEKP